MLELDAPYLIDPSLFLRRLDNAIAESYPVHPFSAGVDREGFIKLIVQYAAMSKAFPYIQCGAVYSAYSQSLGVVEHQENVQVSAAVGAFLAWDEFGGHELVLRDGAKGLLTLTEVNRNFHSSMLCADMGKLLSVPFTAARPDQHTTAYLERLFKGLSNPGRNRNIAHMLAFERHAFAMITALQGAIVQLFGNEAMSEMGYFRAHIGDSGNGEAVHVAITGAMLEKLIRPAEQDDFLDECLAAYGMNQEWCASLVDSSRASS